MKTWLNMNIHKFMGPNEMICRALRELPDIVAKTLLVISEKSWQSGKVLDDWKKGRPRELLTCQPHLCTWEDHEAGTPGSYAMARGKEGSYMG